MIGAPNDNAETSALIRVVSRGATSSEIAAVTAVLTATLDELAVAADHEAPGGPTAWERSQRTLRSPLNRGPGAWQRF